MSNCPRCHGEIRTGDGERFTVTFEDHTDGTFHQSTHNLCADCWVGFLGEVNA